MSAPTAISADVRTSAQQVGFVGVENIVKRFVTPEGTVCAVDDVSFDVRRGEFLSVIGPSGCGKSTLFNIIGGLLGDYEGRVTVGGETIRGTHMAIGMVFEDESTFPWRIVLRYVVFQHEIFLLDTAE